MADEAEELGYGGESTDGGTDGDAGEEFSGISEEIANERLETKHKTFFIDLKRNERGLFVKISERSGGRRSTVMIPYEHFDEFSAKLATIRSQGPDPSSIKSE